MLLKRVFYRIAAKLYHHPAQSLSKIFGLRYWIGLFSSSTVTAPPKPQTLIAVTNTYEPLSLPYQAHPIVSIVIPVYNEFAYTYACLKSILLNTGDVSYEVLIGDDCSTDETSQIETLVENLRVVRHRLNLRFLKNCNRTAKHAKGQYLLFLNNDTNVQPGWLSPLVNLMERDATVGLTGSKLIYADGRLQEAGGIIWSDASGWNFGRLDDPTLPKYNYVRDVDYISGASLMIRAKLWRALKGFDEELAPAYYEDSDLAFRVRKAGFRVVYQPMSQVVHFEGVSNGTDLGGGQKSYQVLNQKKFQNKWSEVLVSEHFPNAQEVFWARDRSRGRKTVVFVDHYIPKPDHDAGSRTIYQYLKFAVQQGWNVKFLGENFFYDPDYRGLLESEGIEILAGVYYRDNWREWLTENGAKIDAVFFCRPHVTEQFLPVFRQRCPHASIAYYCVDLHYVRLDREYQITKDPQTLASARAWQIREEAIIQEVDCFVTISSDEKMIIEKKFPGKQCVVIPCFAWEDLKGLVPEPEGRSDLLFVGGFGHPPNRDGLLWFLDEVWPIVIRRNPDLKIHVVGAKPPQDLVEKKVPGMIFHGFVTDEELSRIYRSVQVVVVPLRFGSGVKGKTVEAMKAGVPIVSTPIGVEGLAGLPESMRPVQEIGMFCDSIESLLRNPDQWYAQSYAQLEYVKKTFTSTRAVNRLREALRLEVSGLSE